MSLLDPFADQVPAFSDEDLLTAYERTHGDPESSEVKTLVAELERRGLDA